MNTTIAEIHRALGIEAAYARRRGLPAYADAEALVSVEANILGRPQRLAPDTARDWQAMRHAAERDGVALLMLSGYRSIAEQTDLIMRKLIAGQTLKEILAVIAAPGFSQHHTGRAIDIATPGARPLTGEFEATPAFEWLRNRAGQFGFRLPYVRDNRFGFCYEPWHWSQIAD